MQYSEGRLGRVFVIRVDHGEDLIQSIHRFVVEKKVQSGMIIFLGALREGRLVTGPEEPVVPPTPHLHSFEGGWETLGVATVYEGFGGPKIHIHTSLGKFDCALTGCLRERAMTYLIVEAVLFEMVDLSAKRVYDASTDLHLLSLEKEL